MRIHLDVADGVPIYLQIVQQIRYLVATGRLAPGEELPPIRVLAEQLLVNPNTVARAYRELERLDLVSKRGTVGTFVSLAAHVQARQAALASLASQVDRLLDEAAGHHVGLDELLELVRQRHRVHSSSTPS